MKIRSNKIDYLMEVLCLVLLVGLTIIWESVGPRFQIKYRHIMTLREILTGGARKENF